MVAPFDGTIEFDILESTDGTEVPGSVVGTKDTSVSSPDDTSIVVDMDSMTTGSNAFTKGRIYCFRVVTPANSNDTNVTLVYKWDTTT